MRGFAVSNWLFYSKTFYELFYKIYIYLVVIIKYSIITISLTNLFITYQRGTDKSNKDVEFLAMGIGHGPDKRTQILVILSLLWKSIVMSVLDN